MPASRAADAVTTSTPEQFARKIDREIRFSEPVIRKLGIELE